MAGVRRVTYTFTVNNVKFGVKLPMGYYDNIDTVLGLNKVSDTERGVFKIGTRDAKKNGVLAQIGIMVKKGTRLVRYKIYCPTNRVAEAIQTLEGKNYRGNEIHNAYFTSERSLG